MQKNRNKNKNKQTHSRTLEDSPSPDPWFLSVGPTGILKLWRLGVPHPRFFSIILLQIWDSDEVLNIRQSCLEVPRYQLHMFNSLISQILSKVRLRHYSNLRYLFRGTAKGWRSLYLRISNFEHKCTAYRLVSNS
jgi:hypothetical protein